jgi:hypothetical protein
LCRAEFIGRASPTFSIRARITFKRLISRITGTRISPLH